MPVDRFREFALWKSRPTAQVDRQRIDSLLQVLGRPGWSTVAPTVRNPTVGGRPHGSTGSSDKAPMASFSRLFIKGHLGAVFYKIFGDF